MKSVVSLASLALIASASAAFAADPGPTVTPGPLDAPPAFPQVYPALGAAAAGPLKARPAYGKTTIYDWTGFYLGINGGGAFGSAKWSSPSGISGRSDMSSGLVGGTVGYNLQTGEPWVLGVELDLDWSYFRASASPTFCPPGCDELKAPWLDTNRLRFGWAFDGIVPGGILPYVTGGVAFGMLKADIAGTPFGTQEQADLGWTAGAGVEFVITGALRAKVEYLYVDLGDIHCGTACAASPVSFSPTANVIRAGLNYRLWMN